MPGFETLPAATAREYLINAYAWMVFHTLLRDSTLNRDRRFCAAIAMKLRNRLLSEESNVRPIDIQDERRKLSGRCMYCGRAAESMDHLIPRLRGGPDSADNLIPACRQCNSSKGGRDVLLWAASKGFFPLPVIRRYLVLAWRWTERAGLLESPLEVLHASDPPFLVGGIPWSSSAPVMLKRQPVASMRQLRCSGFVGR